MFSLTDWKHAFVINITYLINRQAREVPIVVIMLILTQPLTAQIGLSERYFSTTFHTNK